MHVMVLGATGMLGHRLMAHLQSVFRTVGTTRGTVDDLRSLWPFKEAELIGGIDAAEFATVAQALRDVRPQVVVNCIGLVPQRSADDAVAFIGLNALFPHKLARLCRELNARLIHFSTDCVFSGEKGPYQEESPALAQGLYGRTKHLGEIESGALTLRCSHVGREIANRAGLVEWAISCRGGRIKGFSGALFTGPTTDAVADVLISIIRDHPKLEGVWHLAGEAISKFDFLTLLNRTYELALTIERDGSFRCDRRLDGSRLAAETGIVLPPWTKMVATMKAQDGDFYNRLTVDSE